MEPNTKFAHQALLLPDEDTQAEQYLYMCEYLEARGYEHYEISNFAKNGKRSRHNMKYWTLKDYIGIGPSAHSFFNGKRFFYPKNLKEFLNLPKTVFEETTYGIDERLMLECRLKEGICIYDYYTEPSKQLQLSLEKMKNAGLINFNPPHLSLTNSGMLVSNSIITEIMELLYENL